MLIPEKREGARGVRKEGEDTHLVGAEDEETVAGHDLCLEGERVSRGPGS